MRFSNSNKEKPRAKLVSKLTMTTTGSQIEISSSNFSTLTPMRSFQVKTPELELLLSMTTNPVRLHSKSKEQSELSQPSHSKSRLLERMEVTVSSLLTLKPFNWINLTKPLLPVETSSKLVELSLSSTARLNN